MSLPAQPVPAYAPAYGYPVASNIPYGSSIVVPGPAPALPDLPAYGAIPPGYGSADGTLPVGNIQK